VRVAHEAAPDGPKRGAPVVPQPRKDRITLEEADILAAIRHKAGGAELLKEVKILVNPSANERLLLHGKSKQTWCAFSLVTAQRAITVQVQPPL
jgi:hypothetical protein